MVDMPKFENAPGHVVKRRKAGWAVKWQSRTDLAKKGFEPRSRTIWVGVEPSDIVRSFVSHQCNLLQNEMLRFGSEGHPTLAGAFDGTIKSLVRCYMTDPDSKFKKLRFASREHYTYLCTRLIKEHGDEQMKDIKARTFLRWHEEWTVGGKVAMGHYLISMLRILLNFGATILERDDCAKLAAFLHGMKFENSKPRTAMITAEQVLAIRAKAHEMGWHSIALSQMIQYQLMLRQRDVIGEWVPVSEPGISDVVVGQHKWLRGLRWDEIDANLILRHITSKRQKEITPDLKNAPMIMEEFARFGAELPTSGPIVVNETTGVPYTEDEFRARWRMIADLCGVPKNVRNMDSRALAITEALQAGASLDSVRKAATHSNVAMTQRYSRGDADETATVMKLRTAHQNKSGTK